MVRSFNLGGTIQNMSTSLLQNMDSAGVLPDNSRTTFNHALGSTPQAQIEEKSPKIPKKAVGAGPLKNQRKNSDLSSQQNHEMVFKSEESANKNFKEFQQDSNKFKSCEIEAESNNKNDTKKKTQKKKLKFSKPKKIAGKKSQVSQDITTDNQSQSKNESSSQILSPESKGANPDRNAPSGQMGSNRDQMQEDETKQPIKSSQAKNQEPQVSPPASSEQSKQIRQQVIMHNQETSQPPSSQKPVE